MAFLQVIQGPQRGRIFELKKSGSAIGRQRETLPLSDEMNSRRHARVFYQNGRWLIEDLGSANGTFILAQESSHFLHEDVPDLVLDAIRQTVEQISASRR